VAGLLLPFFSYSPLVTNLTPFSFYFPLSHYPYRRAKRGQRVLPQAEVGHTHTNVSPSSRRGMGRLDWGSNSMFGYSGLFLLDYPNKCTEIFTLTYVLHVSPILLYLILLTARYTSPA
jgi:hypothetical protein